VRAPRPVAAAALLAAAWLVGCRAEPPAVARLEARPTHLRLGFGEAAGVELAFEPLARLPDGGARPIVFLHLLDEGGLVVRTFDHELPEPWREGSEIRYRARIHQSALAEPLEPGVYTLAAGLYARDGERFALRTLDVEVARREYRVGIVEVPALATPTAHARFSDSWRPTEPGGDRQVLARRRLGGSGAGTIRFGPLEGPGRLLVGLVVPSGGGGERVELQAGETLAKVRLRSSCGGGEVEISGPGGHELELEIPAGSPVTCEIEIVSNFLVRSEESAEATSVRLDLLAWERAADGA